MKTISQIELNMLIEKHNRYLMTITDKKKDDADKKEKVGGMEQGVHLRT